MKIYNEVITQFNDLTGQWETIFEDSFEYGGPMAMAAGMPPNASQINTSDTIADTIKTTAGYFTNGDGTLEGTIVYTGSLSDSNELYYFNVNHKTPTDVTSETQFSVAFGHIVGSGSNQYGDSTTNPSNLKGATQAIYKQFTSLLMEETEASGGFKISAAGTSGVYGTSKVRDEYFYALIGKRDKFKDRINKKAWTIQLSGSNTLGGGTSILHLTDDSSTVAAIATPGGPRYNIVSGTLGVPTGSNPSIAYSHRTFGWFYPERGVMVFSGVELSASIPGAGSGSNMTASFSADTSDAYFRSSSGFAPNTNAQGNPANALRFINCMRNVGSDNTLQMRSEEDATQESYFCRIKSGDYNFSSNPTFVSGALNKISNITMMGNPTTFITGIGLYNSAGQLLAVAEMSKPLKKNFVSEATIKVKLSY